MIRQTLTIASVATGLVAGLWRVLHDLIRYHANPTLPDDEVTQLTGMLFSLMLVAITANTFRFPRRAFRRGELIGRVIIPTGVLAAAVILAVIDLPPGPIHVAIDVIMITSPAMFAAYLPNLLRGDVKPAH